MSTIGHPLSDLSNLFTPFAIASQYIAFPAMMMVTHQGFLPDTRAPGLPQRRQLQARYAEVADWNPTKEAAWGDAFGLFRNSVIMQGIAARYAMRQASSAKAKEHSKRVDPFGEFAWVLVQAAKREAQMNKTGAKL